MSYFLRPAWRRPWFSFFVSGYLFAIILGAFRAAGMLGGRSLQFLLPLGFVIMTMLPFVFLNHEGRKAIGLQRSNNVNSYATGILIGCGAAWLCYLIGIFLFGSTDDNWFITIRNSYLNNPGYQPDALVLQQFIVFTIPAIIFSPIGEEIFFRGFLQQALMERLDSPRAAIVDALFFGVVHLVHHGIVVQDGQLVFHPLSGFVWVMLMSATAWMFGWIRMHSGSLYPAMLAHAGFNATMNYLIFYHLK